MSSSVRSSVNHHRSWKKKKREKVSDKGWNERAGQREDEWQRSRKGKGGGECEREPRER